MRTVVLSSLLAGFLLGQAGSVRADDPRAIVEKAVKAVGGLDRITSVKAIQRKSKAIYHAEGTSFQSESFSQSPDHLKIVQRAGDKNDGPISRILVLEGDKGWMMIDGVLVEFDEEMTTRFRRARHADRVSGLVALLKDKDKKYTLTALGESKVKDTPAVGVKVSAEGQPDISLFFDKSTGLLLKSSQRITEPRVDNEQLHEWYYSDYRTLDPAGADKDLLEAARIATDGPGLLEFLRQRTPTAETRTRIKELIRQLSSTSFRVRTTATAELKKFGPEAGALLHEAVQDPDREVSRRAEECLEHINRQPAAAQVQAALRLIGLRKPAGAAAVLLAYAPWAQDERVAEQVRATLAEVAFHDGKPDPVVEKAAKADDPQVRLAATAALARDPSAFLKQPGRRIIVEGLRYPARSELYRDGQKHMELHVLDVQMFNRLDDSIFARPSPER